MRDGAAGRATASTREDVPNPELTDMTRRFWLSTALALPLLLLSMSSMFPAVPVVHTHRRAHPDLDPIDSGYAGRRLGREAVFRARLDLAWSIAASTCSR